MSAKEALINAGGQLLGQGVDYLINGSTDEQNRKATERQVAANKELADYTQNLQKDMYEYTYNMNTPEAMVNNYKKAGLSVGLMYSGGAQGAGGATAGTAQAGQAGRENVDTRVARQEAATSLAGMALQNSLLKAQKENIEADTEQKEALTKKESEETITTTEMRPIIKAAAQAKGTLDWVEKLEKEFDDRNVDYVEGHHNIFGYHLIEKEGIYARNKIATINEMITKADLNTMLGNEARASRLLKMSQAALADKELEQMEAKLLNETLKAWAAGKTAKLKEQEVDLLRQKIEYETGETWNTKQVIEVVGDAVGTTVGAFVGSAIGTKALKTIPKNSIEIIGGDIAGGR